MGKPLVSLRRRAARKQGHRCYYCGSPMWEEDPGPLIAGHRISPAQATLLRCTAEHLVPKSEGGANSAANIVAACFFCNQTRHRAQTPLPSSQYKRYVANRMKHGRWLAGMLPFIVKGAERNVS